ncbi:MAG: serine/threonine-protein kinase [Planctomycetota bacterium]
MTTLGSCRLLRKLGSGAMGTVHLAEVESASGDLPGGEQVAIKVLHPHLLAEEGLLDRFLREAAVGKRVRHENVVRTLDVGSSEVDGGVVHYLVLEYVEGRTLRGLLRELKAVPEALLREIARQIAAGLAAIHGAGLVHRDLKPENVLITDDHRVRIMDLGVALDHEELERLSRTGEFVGAFGYAAPEQFQGDEVDGRADLFALGEMLYELASGRHPFEGRDLHKVVLRVLEEEPRRVAELAPQLSPYFEELIHALLAKSPDERPKSATAVRKLLEDGEQGGWWAERAATIRRQTHRPLRRMRIPRETALYGRDDDLAALRFLYEKTKKGEGQMVLVGGEAGIGKSRLVDEFVGRLQQEGEDVNFLFGSYPPGGAATAAGAFATAYREQFGEASLEETLEPYLRRTPVLVPAFAALLRGESAPTDAQGLTKESLQTVFVHATRGLAAERPTIVLIDDLHFAPEDGRALFASLALAVPGHRILLIGTSRPGLPEAWIANLERQEPASRRELERLAPQDLTLLLRDAFESKALAGELAAEIALKSDGNPFFVFEIIRGMREGRYITKLPDGRWTRTGEIERIEIPSSVKDLIQARVADLEDEDRELLDAAACWGFRFDPALVAAAVGAPLIPSLRRLARLEAKHRLVRSAGEGFVFDHHQIQEVLHAALPDALSRAYHAALAEALASREGAAERDPEDLTTVALCEHFLKGGHGDKAVRYLEAALRHLESGYQSEQAVALAERALAVPHLLEGSARVKSLLHLNQALAALARRERQGEVLEEAVALAEQTDDLGQQACTRNARADLFIWTSRYEPAIADSEAAIELACRAGDRREEAVARNGLGASLAQLDRFDEGIRHLDQGLSILREIGERRLEVFGLSALSNTYWRQGRNDEALQTIERAVEIAREIGDRALESSATMMLGNVYWAKERNVDARNLYDRALEICVEIGDRSYEARICANLANTFFSAGLSAEALERGARAMAIAREVGDRTIVATTLNNEGHTLLHLGALDEAEASLRAALDIAREIGVSWLEALPLTNLGRGCEERGDLEEAQELHGEALERFEAMGARDRLMALTQLRRGMLWARRGREDEARTQLQEADAIATETGAPGIHVSALLQRALLGDANADDALAAFSEAESHMDHENRTQGRFWLYQLTRDRFHLEAAHDLLTHFVEHAPERYRASTMAKVRLHREIDGAWKTLHPERP